MSSLAYAYALGMSLLVATQITAVATVVLALGAIVTSVYAIRAFGKQGQQLKDQQEMNEHQVTVLGLQAQELKESLSQRRRSQAAQVFIDVEYQPSLNDEEDSPLDDQSYYVTVAAGVSNTSDQPIFNLYLVWLRLGKANVTSPEVRKLAPAETRLYERVLAAPGSGQVSAVAYFRDMAGARWKIGPDGELDQVSRA